MSLLKFLNLEGPSHLDGLLGKSSLRRELYRVGVSKQRGFNNADRQRRKPYTVWSYHPLFLWSRQGDEKLIFEAVDDWRYHPAWQPFKTQLNFAYNQIARDYDLIFTVSQQLKNQLFSQTPQAYHIANGVDIKLFQAAKQTAVKTTQPQVVYSGVIQSRVDFQLLERCLQALPRVKFILAGPVWAEVSSELTTLHNYANFKWLGPVAYEQLPTLLAQSWVGIIPHKITDLTRSMDPMKLYEYLAAGLKVVATDVIRPNYPNRVLIARSYDEFINALQKILSFNSQQSSEIDLLNLDWSRRYARMLEQLE